MKALIMQNLDERHSIEIGWSTWDETERSVRDRWVTKNGGFSPHSSSEIPMESIQPIMEMLAKHDELEVSVCAEIIAALAASISRRT